MRRKVFRLKKEGYSDTSYNKRNLEDIMLKQPSNGRQIMYNSTNIRYLE